MFRRLAAFLLVALAAFGAPEQVRLLWDANSEPDLAGYRLRMGSAPGKVERVIDVGLATNATVTITNLTYFTLTAYNTAGLESDPSNEISAGSTNGPAALPATGGYRVVVVQFVP